jgi:hypothetical protein
MLTPTPVDRHTNRFITSSQVEQLSTGVILMVELGIVSRESLMLSLVHSLPVADNLACAQYSRMLRRGGDPSGSDMFIAISG